jgi:hypothetical protein
MHCGAKHSISGSGLIDMFKKHKSSKDGKKSPSKKKAKKVSFAIMNKISKRSVHKVLSPSAKLRRKSRGKK